MATETETMTGRCDQHGTVQASREIPGMGFPFVYFAVARALARRKPYRCPECGAAIRQG